VRADVRAFTKISGAGEGEKLVREERGYSSLTPDIRESATTAGDVLLCLSLPLPPAPRLPSFCFVHFYSAGLRCAERTQAQVQ
jgi:hypothetical protein